MAPAENEALQSIVGIHLVCQISFSTFVVIGVLAVVRPFTELHYIMRVYLVV